MKKINTEIKNATDLNLERASDAEVWCFCGVLLGGIYYIDGLVQDCSHSIIKALELVQPRHI